MTKDLKITNIATALGEATLYNRFSIQASVSHVSDIDKHERDGNMMTVRSAVVHKNTSFATIRVFSHFTKEIADGKSYQFTNVNVGRYKKEPVLKTIEIIRITSIKDLDVNIYDGNVTPNTVTFDEKFTSVQLGRLTVVYQFPKCYSEVDIEDEMAIRDHCSTASAEYRCISK